MPAWQSAAALEATLETSRDARARSTAPIRRRGLTALTRPADEPPMDPAAVRALDPSELEGLAARIRQKLVEVTAVTGGHLGPNLGVVELTIALHRAFDSPREALVWDTGHQSYVHKMLTGRWDLPGLRQRGGTAGYPARAESEHDVVENSHASGAIAWAHGIDRGHRLRGEPRCTVAIIGDGALTGGVGLEALNELAADPASRTVVVLNDNTRSYAPTVGGLAAHLQDLRASAVAPGEDAFSQLGLTYLGPVDGHDHRALATALEEARQLAEDPAAGVPIVHVVTRKGMGFTRAEQHLMDHWHSTGPFEIEEAEQSLAAEEDLLPAATDAVPASGDALAPAPVPAPTRTWTAAVGQGILEAARRDPRIIALSAAMIDPVGLTPMQEEMPERVLDVGIAEQLAMDTAAGLSRAGARPVLALYSTFLNRAVDQLLLDVALHGEDVTITLDRAGVTGDDGPSHHGIWDLALACQIPGLALWAPRDGARLRSALPTALARPGASIVRFPKGSLPEDLPAIGEIAGMDVLHGNPDTRPDALLVAVGSLASRAVEAAHRLDDERAREGEQQNILVVDPLQALPLPEPLVDLAATAGAVVTVEDGVRERGIGAALGQALLSRATRTRPAPPLRTIGVQQGFPAHAKRDQILADMGMDVEGIARTLREVL